MTIQQNFKVFAPLTKSRKGYTIQENGTLEIIGIASTSNEDLEHDIILPSAIDSMKKQLLHSKKNLHGDHQYGLNGILGSIHEVLDTDENSLKIGATILSKYAPHIKEMLDIGVELGLSIGGKPTIMEPRADGGFTVKDLELYEISLTAMPANMDTLGTVTTKDTVAGKCLSGVCFQLLKNYDEETTNMPEQQQQNDDVDVESIVVDKINELWIEKEDEFKTSMTESITQSVMKEVTSIVQDEFKKLQEQEEQPAEEQPVEDDVAKGLTVEDLESLINKSVSSNIKDTFGDFQKQFFKGLEEKREPTPTLNLQEQESLIKHEQPAEDTVKTYSLEDTAQMLINKQRNANPLLNEVLNRM